MCRTQDQQSYFRVERECYRIGLFESAKQIRLLSVGSLELQQYILPLTCLSDSLDEKVVQRPTDSYALAKMEAEIQCESFVHWFPDMRIASLRIHEVQPLKTVQKEHEEDPEFAAKQLWAWVNPTAVARACMLGVTSEGWKGHEGEYL